jgi:hypothetical protein
MAAMAIPEFSGKVVDYPEWRKLFKDCVESQYEESAAVMTLRNQALPADLVSLVPRCAELATVWEKLDKRFLDPSRVWKGVKADLRNLDRKKLGNLKYMAELVSKLVDAENLLETVGMVQWLRQEDKIPEYEDMLIESERLEWVKMRPSLTGTPWENFRAFLLKMRDWYEEVSKTGTQDFESEEDSSKKKTCDYCNRRGHLEKDCFQKRDGLPRGKYCFKCGSDQHIARDCEEKVSQKGGKVSKVKVKAEKVKAESEKKSALEKQSDQESHSNYLRTKDCRWCGRVYNTIFSCSGCDKKWAAKSKAEHCLAHCISFCDATPKEKGEMVLKGGNCVICLHHEHATGSCFGIDQPRTICGLNGCKKRHHPSLHSAPQSSVQSVQMASHSEETGDTSPGVEAGENKVASLVYSGTQGKFLDRVGRKKVLTNRVNWTDPNWTLGGTVKRLEEMRAKELLDMKEILKLPLIDGNKVLLLMQIIEVKHGPKGDLSQLVVFWDDGSTCSLVVTDTAEMLQCPGEAVTVSIETINGSITRETKVYCVELMNNSGDRVIIRAFGVEKISEVIGIKMLAEAKSKFSDEIQSQWSKVTKRPIGRVHLLVGQEYAGFHPIPFEANNNLVVCRSMFGQGWLLTGTDDGLQAEECIWGEEVAAMRVGRVTVVGQCVNRVSVSQAPLPVFKSIASDQVKLTYTQEREILSLDDLGVEPPRRCQNCKGCKECSWRGQKLSRQEAFELEYLEKCVEFKGGRFHIRFPFLVDPLELSDNYNQVVKIAEAEERKLLREGYMDRFNELFTKLEDLGVVEEISKTEMQAWKGPVHYISLQHVIIEESASTPLRIVSNSSLKSPGNPHTLNGILAKGPNMLSDPYKILIRFRSYLRGLNSDVTKAYYQMFTGLVEKHVRRMVWRYGDKQSKWKVFGYTVVSFGDTPAAALLEICLKHIIMMFYLIDPIAAERLLHDKFVDDITSGGDVEQVRRFKGNEDPETLACDGTMSQILGGGNFELKAIAVSLEPDGEALRKLSGSVLGHPYSTERDTLAVRFYVNVTTRRRGMPTGPDLTVDTLYQLESVTLTRRKLLGVASSQFDMLGMVSPLIIKLRVGVRDLFIKENQLEWDTVLTGKLVDTWTRYIVELVQTGMIEFRRCVRPEGEVKEFTLVAFFDGSDQAFAGVVYCRWKMADGSVLGRLLCSKARVTPLQRISTPRSELNGAVVVVRLLWTVIQALELEELPTTILIGGDSETVLAAREKACGALGEYFGNRVGESWYLQEKISELVPVGIAGGGEWYHMSSMNNAAERPTRLDSKPEDLRIDSVWQEGLPYMRLPFDDWPWERDFAERKVSEAIPKEELKAQYRGCTASTKTMEVKNPILEMFEDGYITNDYDKLIDKTEPLFRWLARFRSKRSCLLTLTSRELTVRFWFRISMPATRAAAAAGKLRELTLLEVEDMMVVKGRAVPGMMELYGVDSLPVIMPDQRIAVLVMLKSHEESDHKSIDITLSQSRHYCWIVGGRKLAKTVCKFCVRCRYLKKKHEDQKMSPLPKELCVPCPAFTNVGLDLAGPYKVTSMLKKRGTRAGHGTLKVWAVLVMCLNSRALKVYLAPGYASQDFMLAWKEFQSDCGVPRRVHSDRGSQLISAASGMDLPEYDWDQISAENKGQTEWRFCPSGAQWRNGAIEAFVKQFKWSLQLYQNTSMNYAELQSVFKSISAVINSRPISARYGPRHSEVDPDYLELITPNMLLTGRSGVDLPGREYAGQDTPSKRLSYKEELECAWWRRWIVQCFDSLIPSKTWTQARRGVKVGDVVLISYSDKSKSGTFKFGIVESVETDQDGLVRTCVVGYRIVRSDLPVKELRLYYRGLKYKKIRVPVQLLVVILPIEEQEEPNYLSREKKVEEVAGDNVISCEKDEDVVTTVGDTSDQVGSKVDFENFDEDDGDGDDKNEDNFVEDVESSAVKQAEARSFLVRKYEETLSRKVKVQKTWKSVKLLHRNFSLFETTSGFSNIL